MRNFMEEEDKDLKQLADNNLSIFFIFVLKFWISGLINEETHKSFTLFSYNLDLFPFLVIHIALISYLRIFKFSHYTRYFSWVYKCAQILVPLKKKKLFTYHYVSLPLFTTTFLKKSYLYPVHHVTSHLLLNLFQTDFCHSTSGYQKFPQYLNSM